jgi:pilus assembly protein CpaE
MTPSSSKLTRVAAVCESGSTQQQIITALSSQPEFQLVDVLDNLDKLSRDLRAAEPDILLVDHRVGGRLTMDILDDLTLQFPEVALVAILPGEDSVSAQQVTLAGAWAFIIQPFTQVNLLSTLRRVRDLRARRVQTQPAAILEDSGGSGLLHTLTVFSPRGGSGCSTVAINLAIALNEATGKRVLLLDGKLYFGHLDVLLNIRSQNSLIDLIPHASALDPDLVQDVVVQHSSGIHVLLGPTDVQVAQGIRAQDLYNVVVALQHIYELVVIDAGSSLSENTVTLMDASERVLILSNPDMASLRDASRFVQISRSLAFPPDKVLNVLNRAGIEGGVKIQDIEKALHQSLYAQIPDDPANALRSLNRGIPRSPASRGIQTLAKALVASSQVAPSFSSNGSKPAAAKKKTSLLSSIGAK